MIATSASVVAPALPAPVPNGSFHDLMAEVLGTARAALDAQGVSIDLQVPRATALPSCPAETLRRALLGTVEGLASASVPRTQMLVRCERKPVLLKSREGEVRRDFLMVALAHTGRLTPDDQQRVVQGVDPGPLGQATRLVREMGGFVRFAPLPGGALEARLFLPVA